MESERLFAFRPREGENLACVSGERQPFRLIKDQSRPTPSGGARASAAPGRRTKCWGFRETRGGGERGRDGRQETWRSEAGRTRPLKINSADLCETAFQLVPSHLWNPLHQHLRHLGSVQASPVQSGSKTLLFSAAFLDILQCIPCCVTLTFAELKRLSTDLIS